MPTFIVRTCDARNHYWDYLKKTLPAASFCVDDFDKSLGNNTPYFNVRKAMQMADGQPTVFLEDDVLFCEDFNHKVTKEINQRPNDIIQFFSMRKADLTIGSRYDRGSLFMMGQCFYLPAGVSNLILDCWQEYGEATAFAKRGYTDALVAYALQKNKLKYWICIPNLVDHRVGTSIIDKRRAKTNRQSFTFEAPSE